MGTPEAAEAAEAADPSAVDTMAAAEEEDTVVTDSAVDTTVVAWKVEWNDRAVRR